MSVFKFSCPEYVSLFYKSLKTLHEEDKSIDLVNFICKDKVCVYVHKLVLISVSPLLRQIIQSVPWETENLYISLPDVESRIMNIFVKFLYNGFSTNNQEEMILLYEIFKIFSVNLANCEIVTGSKNLDLTSEKMLMPIKNNNSQEENQTNIIIGNSISQDVVLQHVSPLLLSPLPTFYTYPHPFQYSMIYFPNNVQFLNCYNVELPKFPIQDPRIYLQPARGMTADSAVTQENNGTLPPMSVLQSNYGIVDMQYKSSSETLLTETCSDTTLTLMKSSMFNNEQLVEQFIISENSTPSVPENIHTSLSTTHEEHNFSSLITEASEVEQLEMFLHSESSTAALCEKSTEVVFEPTAEDCSAVSDKETEKIETSISKVAEEKKLADLDTLCQNNDTNVPSDVNHYESSLEQHALSATVPRLKNFDDSPITGDVNSTSILESNSDGKNLSFDNVEMCLEDNQSHIKVASRNSYFEQSHKDKLLSAVSDFEVSKQDIPSAEDSTTNSQEMEREYEDIKLPFEIVETILHEQQADTQFSAINSHFMDSQNDRESPDINNLGNENQQKNLYSSSVNITTENSEPKMVWEENYIKFEVSAGLVTLSETCETEMKMKIQPAVTDEEVEDNQRISSPSEPTHNISKKIMSEHGQRSLSENSRRNDKLSGTKGGFQNVKKKKQSINKLGVRKTDQIHNKNKPIHTAVKKSKRFLKRFTRSSRVTRSHGKLSSKNNNTGASTSSASILVDQPKYSNMCKFCGKLFITVSALSSHMVNHGKISISSSGTKTGKYIPDKNASQRSNELKGNAQIKNRVTVRFPCKKCKTTCYSLASLEKHQSLHDRKRPFSCQTCCKAFIRQADLRSHMFVHTNARPHTCQVCGKRFKMKKHLKTHMHLLHHEEDSQP